VSTVLVTGASSGFGALTVRALGRRGHTVFAGIRETTGRNAGAVEALARDAAAETSDLRALELDVQSEESVAEAVARITGEGDLDVVVHNAGHMVLGPAEAFTAEQLASVYDVNVLGAQRVNRAALPHLRARGSGLLVWVGSSSTKGGCPPFLAPYFAAKAAMEALAVSYSTELQRFGIDTTIVVPGAFTRGTNHFAHAGTPADTATATAYDERYAGLMDDVTRRLAALEPADADAGSVARAVADVVATAAGRRPLHVHVDPSRDGSEVVTAVADRIRSDFYHRLGLEDLLVPGSSL
jgi:NAD(P)-dependent dehydrogenase (short-subunit alcohol dehydrogenase family)